MRTSTRVALRQERVLAGRRDLARSWDGLRRELSEETGLRLRGWPVALVVLAAGAGLVLALRRGR